MHVMWVETGNNFASLKCPWKGMLLFLGMGGLQNGWIFGKVPGGGVIFNPKNYIADFVPLKRAFWAWLSEKFATWFSKNEGGGQSRLELFRKFIPVGGATRSLIVWCVTFNGVLREIYFFNRLVLEKFFYWQLWLDKDFRTLKVEVKKKSPIIFGALFSQWNWPTGKKAVKHDNGVWGLFL